MNTDRAWEDYGRHNPYYGVLAVDQYRGKRLSEAALDAFFHTGQLYAAYVLARIDERLGGVPRGKALDFGCGVGRVAIPLAQRFAQCVGVDISPSMLQEAQHNAQRLGASNMQWYTQLSALQAEHARFDFVNSVIVLQHIAPERGLRYIAQLLELLNPGGCGAIHLTYGHLQYARTLGDRPVFSRALHAVRRPLDALRRQLTRRDPQMQMHAYPVNRVLFHVQQSGVTDFCAEFTDHLGYLGVTLYFKKP